MTRIIEVNRCIECPLRQTRRDYELEGTHVDICTHAYTEGYLIPDIDTIPQFCALRVL